jgi:arylsulfatase A-like enzyme
LRGQLTSSYQFKGGYNASNDGLGQITEDEINNYFADTLVSLPNILENNGYHTYFLSAHSSNSQLNRMLKTLGFEHIYGAEDFHDSKESLSDQEIFSVLAELITHQKLNAPYFLGIYNLGTHLGQDSPDKKYGDGKNILLNSIHNFDNAFGKFLERVKGQKDLVIIFTADHAAYPSKVYNQTFGTNRSCFVDKIPFIIWHQGIKPETIDIQGRNSLTFAPTLLNAIHINSAFNYFLGCSLFDKSCPQPFEFIANIGDEFYRTPNLTKLDDNNPEDRIIKQKIRDFFNLSENQNLK